MQGPLAQVVLQKLTNFDLNEIGFFEFKERVRVSGFETLISRTGYTGEDGFEVYANPDEVEKIWKEVIAAGKPEGIEPAGLGARDTLRFEATLPLYGHEINKDVTPLEAGLAFFVYLDGDDFIGKSALVKQKKRWT